MTDDLNSIINQLEARLARLEQSSMSGTTGVADISYDATSGVTTVADQLDWTVAANSWEPYSTVGPAITDPTDDNYPGAALSTPYGRPEAHLLGRQCLLTGVVRRKAGATPNPLAAGTRYDLPMFGLPPDWRPNTNIILPCLIGNSDPTVAPSVVGTGWIEIKPEYEPVQASGRAYYVAGTVALQPSTGWIALQGIFPCQMWDADPATYVQDSWDDAHFQTTWDLLGDDVTWNNYTTLSS